MNTKLFSLAVATLALLSASLVFASPSDGIHPGVAPAPWLVPATPNDGAPSYALTGTRHDTAERRTYSRNGLRRETQQVGKDVRVDAYRR